jgi:hypothetical protein
MFRQKGRHIVYLHAKFHMPNSHRSLVTVIKPKAVTLLSYKQKLRIFLSNITIQNAWILYKMILVLIPLGGSQS